MATKIKNFLHIPTFEMGKTLKHLSTFALMKVQVMKPRFKPENHNSFILYPYHIFYIRLHYKRLGMKDKIFNYFGYIDLLRMGIERGDGIIGIEDWDVDEKNVIEPIITDYEELKKFAMKKAVEWGALRIVSWWHPLVEVVDDFRAYKIFWIYKKNDKTFIMDSFNGHEFPLEELMKHIKQKN